jgi:Zn-dependent alcohol dehydrogenase
MKTRAAVSWQAGQPLTIETVDLEGPRAGEVLVEVKATGIAEARRDQPRLRADEERRVDPLGGRLLSPR